MPGGIWKPKNKTQASMNDDEGRHTPRGGWDSDNWREVPRRSGYGSDGYRSAGSTGSDRSKGRGRGLAKDPGGLLNAPFSEDVAVELNTKLEPLGIQIPLLAGRTPQQCKDVSFKALGLLKGNHAEAPTLLQALSLLFTWCGSLSDDEALELLGILTPLCLTAEAEPVRYHAIHALNIFFKNCFPKKKQAALAEAISLLPEHPVTEKSVPSILWLFLYDPSFRVRTQAVNAASHLVEHTSQLMTQAASTTPGRSFLSYSEKLGCILKELHHTILLALRCNDPKFISPAHTASLLHLLQSVIVVSPYFKLPQVACELSTSLPELYKLLSGTDKGTVIAAAQVICAAAGTKKPIALIGEAFEKNESILDHACSMAKTDNCIAYRIEAARLWTALAKNYPHIAAKRWDELKHLMVELQKAPDQMSKLTAIGFIVAVSEQGLPAVLQPNDEIPVIDFSCFGESHLPPGADPRGVNAAGELQRKPTGAESVPRHCVLTGKEAELTELMVDVIIPLTKDPVAAVRGHAVSALGNVTPDILSTVDAKVFDMMLNTVIKVCSDVNNTVMGSAARVVGMWVGTEKVLIHRKRIVTVLLAMFKSDQQALHQKAAWAVASLCDQMKEHPSTGDDDLVRQIMDACVLYLKKCKSKMPWNVVRALGNSGLLYKGDLGGVLGVLVSLFDDPNVKVRWNTAYAVAQIFRNPTMREGDTGVSTTELVIKLSHILHDEANFKVRIQVCWALSALARYPELGKTLPEALRGTVLALEGSDKDVDFEQYKYRDVLMVSLRGLLLHLVRLGLRCTTQHEVEDALMKYRSSILVVLQSMLPDDTEPDDSLVIDISSPHSKQDINEMLIKPQELKPSHDIRWLPLKEEIEIIISALNTLDGAAVDLTTLQNFASLFQLPAPTDGAQP
eukprot:TRINITY_DN26117_c0_g1_i2.p1 TRINITY_DN26117_c0_g1~~TRINITY_DN26117_c0_g1_i2.p1  ORF type:complete len:905 (+),score=290.93 TRINITY_DN26117_c0_g1_i2:54-2768(+)